MATFEMVPTPSDLRTQTPPEHDGLGGTVLHQNARWFTQVRWGVAAIFLAFGLICGAGKELLQSLGFCPPNYWPYGLAGILVAANAAFSLSVHHLRGAQDRRLIEVNIWSQILLDLLVVTMVVHFVGSTSTFIAFAYLFHITLACIFFAPASSLLIALIAAALYFGCVGLEITGVLPPCGIFAEPPIAHGDFPWPRLIHAASAVFVWFFVWYLTSTLSRSVRNRDQQLDRANRELQAADEEKNRLVLRTTHDLKAPFSGIESNIQVLKSEYWNEVPPSVRHIVEQIEVRAQTLSERIRDILTLGNLRSRAAGETTREAVSIHDVLDAVACDFQELARARSVSLVVTAPPLFGVGNKQQMAILFSNLVANAILYSNAGGRVTVAAGENADVITVTVTDEGIGIEKEALPRIFDEYYRTVPGARFNKLSTGLGLTIVKKVAQNLGFSIRVTSEPGKGTSVAVMIPGAGSHTT